ncbi:MAG: hypothetical protein EB033_07320 [Proteobacteria bacterium]|nr:hypothetical protein [Pseudomonadota bacterium]
MLIARDIDRGPARPFGPAAVPARLTSRRATSDSLRTSSTDPAKPTDPRTQGTDLEATTTGIMDRIGPPPRAGFAKGLES